MLELRAVILLSRLAKLNPASWWLLKSWAVEVATDGCDDDEAVAALLSAGRPACSESSGLLAWASAAATPVDPDAADVSDGGASSETRWLLG